MTTYTGAALESKFTTEEWAEDFADTLTCFPGDSVNKALFGYFATTHHQDEPIHYDQLCRGFLDLLDRHILVPDFRSDLASEQISDMRARFAPDTIPAQPPPPRDPGDFSAMTKVEFDRIPTSDSRRLYRINPSFQRRADYFWNGGK